MLVLILGPTYWIVQDTSRKSQAEYDSSLIALKKYGELVDVTILGKIKVIRSKKKIYFVDYTQISYTDVITNKVVKRYVSQCGDYPERSDSERPAIGCMFVNEPLKMLYVPGNDKMWEICKQSEYPNHREKFLCGTSHTTHTWYRPFTFDVERFK